ncbi:winged helix-turn-helix transcriptional regulator [Halosimplex aquaticum]|uniref:Winged helix-turn-helix transcriptional regulator n=1 Tax=Halosimplex aquaticum TaxID=3026162 RepID=A0ABD5Y0G5_9EURY|nr:Lrp/AsnC family transcriptional regulator [Halosimplex aquaticum]
MSADIDDTDRRILDALLDNGRASASELAETVGIATATATKRLQRLEESAVVDGYQPEVDYEAFGYEVTAVFRLDVAGSGLAAVVDDLRDAGHMIGVYEVTGGDDVVAIGKFESTEAMNAQIKDLLTHPEVRSARTSIALETVCEYEPVPVGAAEGE